MEGFYLKQLQNPNVPIKERRGIEHLDLNDELILVQAPIEQVGQALSQMLQLNRWERDVYQRSIELVDQSSLLIFQFRRHPWTIIQSSGFFPHRILLKDEYAQSLSGLLCAKAIYYLISDTGGYIGYHFFNCGESLEKFYKEPPEVFGIEEYEYEDEDENEFIGMCEFRSQLSQKEVHEIGDGYRFTDDFLREQNAYVPAFKWIDDLKAGQKFTISWEGIERNDFERMDYIALTS